MTDAPAFRTNLRPSEHIAEITICRPEIGNQLISPEIRTLGQAIRAAGQNQEIKLIVIRGEGQDFCLGRKPAPPTKTFVISGFQGVGASAPAFGAQQHAETSAPGEQESPRSAGFGSQGVGASAPTLQAQQNTGALVPEEQPSPPSTERRTALDIRSGVVEPLLDIYADIRSTPIPVLAVVQGHARGFGCALAGVCDLTIAADSARFSMPEMDNNLPPTLAISAVLGKVPPKRLIHFIYTRQQISAAEALSWGLISEVAPSDQLETALAGTISRLVDRDRAALSAIKEYMNVAPFVDTAAAARLGANILSTVLSSIK